VEAVTKVTPFKSSITCAYICLLERKTLSLGRSGLPDTFFLIRFLLLRRASCLGFTLPAISPPFANSHLQLRGSIQLGMVKYWNDAI